MKPSRRSILARLDDTLRWTGIPARVADDLSDAPSLDRKHRPLRWIPLLPIALSCVNRGALCDDICLLQCFVEIRHRLGRSGLAEPEQRLLFYSA